jgi:hypothetical protein
MRQLLAVVLFCSLAAGCKPTPTPSPTPTGCPSGYDSYVNSQLGLRVCHPAGWDVRQSEGSVTFTLPFAQAASVTDLYSIIVTVSPAEHSFGLLSDEELLTTTAKTLPDLPAPPRIVKVAGRRAVEYTSTQEHVAEGETIETRYWNASLATDGPFVSITVWGAIEHSTEVEALYRTVVSTLDLFPASASPPTPTPTVIPASVSCPPQYDQHLDLFRGFSVCYPVGWLKDEDTDKETGVFWQFFNSPVAADRPKDFKRIAVGIISGIEDSLAVASDEVLVQVVSDWLAKNNLRQLAAPQVIVICGHRVAEVAYEGIDTTGGDMLTLTGWSAFVAASDRLFFIEVGGASEQGAETEPIYRQVISRFVILPIQ